jgi:phosphoribosylformylglycinamidine synthase PurS subunit
MKAHVFVTLKRTVLDAQGRMHYKGVADVRQGKYFLLTLADIPESEASAEVDRIAREVLVNPVIEEYTYRLEPSMGSGAAAASETAALGTHSF